MKSGNIDLVNFQAIADAFAENFSSVHCLGSIAQQPILSTSALSRTYFDFILSPKNVKKSIKPLKPKFTAGVDDMPAFLLNDCCCF